jgi:DNA-entry nuclease
MFLEDFMKKWVKLGLAALAALSFGTVTPQGSTLHTTSVEAASTKHSQAHLAKTSKASNVDLLKLSYTNEQTVTVNDDKPTFTKKELSTKNGGWQVYSNLDTLNRPTAANALITKKMMPTAKREPLTVDPTGWHNKKLKSGYLYNRSHLIGYQLTGQNNNPKNLMTGTRSLNSPEMLHYEDDIADFLKNNPGKYVRYQVVPVFKGDDLVARGVHMQAKSIGSNQIKFNVYIFNIEDGVTINYATGTSQVSASAAATSNSNTAAPSTATDNNATQAATSSSSDTNDVNTATQGQIVGNINSKIYHVPGQAGYHMNAGNAVYFQTEQQAQAAGYRKALR